VWLTTRAISGEAHRDGQGYHEGRTTVMYIGSEVTVAGFVRFIARLAGSPQLPARPTEWRIAKVAALREVSDAFPCPGIAAFARGPPPS
jgi:hypothetical protein